MEFKQAFLYSISLLLTVSAVSLTQHAIANAIVKSSLYPRMAWGLPLCQIKVRNSLEKRTEYVLISLFLMNYSNFATISGLVFEEVVKPGTAPP